MPTAYVELGQMKNTESFSLKSLLYCHCQYLETFSSLQEPLFIHYSCFHFISSTYNLSELS